MQKIKLQVKYVVLFHSGDEHSICEHVPLYFLCVRATSLHRAERWRPSLRATRSATATGRSLLTSSAARGTTTEQSRWNVKALRGPRVRFLAGARTLKGCVVSRQVCVRGLRGIPLSVDLWIHYINLLLGTLDMNLPESPPRIRRWPRFHFV